MKLLRKRPAEERNENLFVLYFARLNPRFDLIPVPLKLLDFLLQVSLKFLFLVRIIGVVHLRTKRTSSSQHGHRKAPQQRKKEKEKNRTVRRELFNSKEAEIRPCSICYRKLRRLPEPFSGLCRSLPEAFCWLP